MWRTLGIALFLRTAQDHYQIDLLLVLSQHPPADGVSSTNIEKCGNKIFQQMSSYPYDQSNDDFSINPSQIIDSIARSKIPSS
jgi:hypothetical protein